MKYFHLDSFGGLKYWNVICLVISWIIVFMIMMKGKPLSCLMSPSLLSARYCVVWESCLLHGPLPLPRPHHLLLPRDHSQGRHGRPGPHVHSEGLSVPSDTETESLLSPLRWRCCSSRPSGWTPPTKCFTPSVWHLAPSSASAHITVQVKTALRL